MKQYDFTDLVLLVGHNPLPNYVVGEWFITVQKMKLDSIVLVYTLESLEKAERLQAYFKDKCKDVKLWALDKESYPYQIRENLKADINDVKGKKIHLNYTGGTKAMSVHVYDFLKENKDKEFLSKSYLNARKFELVDDEYNGMGENLISGDLRNVIKIDIETLLKLHGITSFEGKKNPQVLKDINGFQYKTTLPILENEINSSRINDIFDITYRKSKLLSNALIDNPNQANLEEKFLNGGFWLEHYVAWVLHNQFDKVYMSIKPIMTGTKTSEIDVGIINGYQLIGISCGVSKTSKEIKLKGMEIIHRVRQFGGDESKAVLIAPCLDPKEFNFLKEQLDVDSGGGIGNILVLGKDDLKKQKLIDKIKDFVDGK